jgi:signal peptidase I
MAPGRRGSPQPNRVRIAAGVVVAAAFVGVWLLVGPSQLGGGATYSITEGVSMLPLLHKNDLALVRTQSTYKVGDIVLYHSSTIHRPVLHRIIAIQNGHYFFTGDNNGFIDPGYATRSELTGKLWIHVPHVGAIVGWVGKPLQAGLIAALTTMFLLLGGVTTHRRRGRRGGQQLAHSGAPGAPRFLLPESRAPLTTLVVLVILGVLLVGVGFAIPSKRSVAQQGAYTNSGTFTYMARLNKPSAAYPSGYAVTGQPLFANLFNSVTTHFAYRFESKLSHQIRGTIEYKALLLSSSSGWQKLYGLEAKRSFSGDTAKVSSGLVIRTLYTLLNTLSTASGTPGAQYSIDLQPVVHVVGTVGGKPIDSTFSPVLPISVTPSVVRLDVAPAVSPPGATYTPQSGADALDAALRPTQSGTIPHQTANLVAIARYEVPVIALRLLGLIALVLAVAFAILTDRLQQRNSGRPEEEVIAEHFGCLVTPVDAVVLAAGSAPTRVRDFASLARLAQYLERPILRQTTDAGTTYAVDDEGRVYEFQAAPRAQTQPERATSVPTAKRRRRFGRPSRLTVAGALIAVIVAITLVTSFTATTNVPTSRVGASNQPRAISQLTPGGCSSLSLTTLVIGSGTFTNTASNALILGKASADTITDNGSHNCIVGGGGKDTVNGDRTDICITGPSPGTTYKKCSTSA